MVDGPGNGNGSGPPGVLAEIHILLLDNGQVVPQWRLMGIPQGYMMLEVMREALLRESLKNNPVPSKSGIVVAPAGSVPPPPPDRLKP